jgi:hypothetical protein
MDMYQGIYELIGSEMSFFSRKLEAQLRFQHIPWRWQFKTEQRKAVLEARAGTIAIAANFRTRNSRTVLTPRLC